MVTGIPGDIVECGVYKLASVIRFATFRSLLENVYSRKLFAFDAFGEFPTGALQNKDDLNFVKSFETAGGDGLGMDESQEILKFKQLEKNTFCIKGDVAQTIPAFLTGLSRTRIAESPYFTLIWMCMNPPRQPLNYCGNALSEAASLSLMTTMRSVARPVRLTSLLPTRT